MILLVFTRTLLVLFNLFYKSLFCLYKKYRFHKDVVASYKIFVGFYDDCNLLFDLDFVGFLWFSLRFCCCFTQIWLVFTRIWVAFLRKIFKFFYKDFVGFQNGFIVFFHSEVSWDFIRSGDQGQCFVRSF